MKKGLVATFSVLLVLFLANSQASAQPVDDQTKAQLHTGM